MTKPKLIFITAIVLISGIVSWTLQNRSVTKLREEKLALQRQADELNRLRDENARLSNLISHASNSNTLSDEEFRALLRSRNEVGQLRRKSAEVNQLRASNQALLTALENKENTPTVQAHWTRDQLGNVGYADPESAIVTTLWALSNDDPDFVASQLTAEEKAQFAAQGKSEADIASFRKRMGEMLNPASATAISLTRKRFTSPEDAIIELYYEGEGKTRKFAMKRVNGQWRMESLVMIIAN